MIRKKVMGYLIGLMAGNTKAIGIMESSMVREFIITLRVRLKGENGRKERESDGLHLTITTLKITKTD